MSWLLSVGGLVGGSIFRSAPWVDEKKAPGETSQRDLLFGSPLNLLRTITMTPNLVWLGVAAAVYVLAPYDLEAAGRWDGEWFLSRARLNLLVVYAYFGWWHFVSHFLSRRKYSPGTYPSLATMAHNVWYTTLGTVQWTVWEMAYFHMLGRGLLPYDSDGEAFGFEGGAGKVGWNVLWVLLIPPFRDFHFYFAHRTIHYRALYKYVHSLHHRNIDIEPFAGLAMHPLEHVYYYSAVAVSLFFKMSPFVFVWNGWHLNLAPAAGHSGWEDHWQADQYHYNHHANFECNYGGPQYCLDHVFGTFREKLGKSDEYKGEWKGNNDTAGAGAGAGAASASDAATTNKKTDEVQKKDGRSNYLKVDSDLMNFLPTRPDHVLYWAYTAASLYALYAAAVGELDLDPRLLGLNLVAGPSLVGVVLMLVSGDRTPLLWPFHRESFPTLAFHLAGTLVFVLIPTYYAVVGALATDPQETAYCLFHVC